MLNSYVNKTRYKTEFMEPQMLKFLFVVLFFLCGCGDDFEEAPPEVARKRSPVVVPADSTAPVVPLTPPPTCDAQDLKIFQRNLAFSAEWSSCSRKVRGNATRTTNCLRTSYDLSSDCGNCFGAFAACGADNCFSACVMSLGTSTKCEQCGWKNCGDGLEKCLGYPRTELAKYY
jgi:hypothetical protein